MSQGIAHLFWDAMNKQVRKSGKLISVFILLLSLVIGLIGLSACTTAKKVESIAITNKTELAAEWTVGDADRTVAVTLSPDSLTPENTAVAVASSDESVIAVNGMVLSAVAPGKATITVSAGDKTDEVEITVSAAPIIAQSVSIANKSELTAEWRVGDADRLAQIEFVPIDANAGTDVTLTSDHTDIISVNGKVLKAHKAGTATITARAGHLTDTVTITVLPTVDSVTITNKDALTAEWGVGDEDRTVEVSVLPADKAASVEVVVTSDKTGVVSVEGNKLHAVKSGTATITVTAGGLTDTVEVTVKLTAPTLTISDNVTEMECYTQTDTALPLAIAKGSDGKNLSASISVTCNDINVTIDSGILKAEKSGTYTILYSITDTRGEDLVAQQEITVTVYRKVFKLFYDFSFEMVDDKTTDEQQTVKATNPGWGWSGAFNMQNSKLYYAEAVFDMVPSAGDTFLGFAHYPDEKGSGYIGANMKTPVIAMRKEEGKTFIISNDWADNNTGFDIWNIWHGNNTVCTRILQDRGIVDNDPRVTKLAVARDGDYFYIFINDQYVSCMTYEAYRDIDTVPGLFTMASVDSTISNIAYCSGAQASAKINALLAGGKNMIGSYVPSGASGSVWGDWAQDSNNIDNRNFTVNPISDERGINFDFTNNSTHFNGGMVSPYIWFEGDFTFSWEYKNTSVSNPADDNSRMMLEVRSREYGDVPLNFGACYRADGRRYLLNSHPTDGDGNWNWYEPGAGFDDSQGVRFTLSRRMDADCATYCMTAQSIANPAQKYSKIFEWRGTRWNEACLVQWHNTGVAGEYSNITWSLEANIDTSACQIEVTNRDALTAQWRAGEADRTVECTFVPDILTSETADVVVTSDNPAVISVSGLTLTAVSAGRATITVSAGTATVSFEITVLPEITSVSITNKDALTAQWRAGEADRTLTLTILPEDANATSGEIIVVSSDTDVISVDGLTLRALSAGKATVTVTVGKTTDTVEITVIPGIESVTITNKDALTVEWGVGDADRVVATRTAPADAGIFEVSVVSSNAEVVAVVTVDGVYYLRAIKSGTATITVSAGDKTDTVDVTVKLTAPAITVADDQTAIDGYHGTDMNLPVVTATGSDGTDLSDSIIVTCNDINATIKNGVFNAIVPGTYTVTYSITDTRGEDLVAQKEITVTVYRKVFKLFYDFDFAIVDDKTAEAQQTVKATNPGWGWSGAFNMQNSKLYYAEAVFDMVPSTGDAFLGFAHYPDEKGSGYIGDNKCTPIVAMRKEEGKTFIISNDWASNNTGYDIWNIWSGNNTVCTRILQDRGIVDNDPRVTKLAVARDGAYFYIFINDQYVSCMTYEAYSDIDTVPGLFTMASVDSTISNIAYCSGAQASAKINALLAGGKNMIGSYVPSGASGSWGDWAQDSNNIDNRNFTVNPISDERGINFDFTNNSTHFNGGMVSPYIWFEGDFTFSWEYKNTSVSNPADDNSRMMLEVRSREYGDVPLNFGACYREDGRRYLLNSHPADGDGNWNWYEPGAGFDDSQGVRFTLSRRIDADCATFSMTAQSIANPEQTYTHTFEWRGTRWNEACLVQWHNTGVAGEYSNITWSLEATINA